jgi:hypothetical protein
MRYGPLVRAKAGLLLITCNETVEFAKTCCTAVVLFQFCPCGSVDRLYRTFHGKPELVTDSTAGNPATTAMERLQPDSEGEVKFCGRFHEFPDASKARI